MARFAVCPEIAAKHRAAARRYRQAHRATFRPCWRIILIIAVGVVLVALLEILPALEAMS